MSTPTPTSRTWLFGDGAIDFGSQTPVHTYAAANTYIISLTVTNSDGSFTSVQPIIVSQPGTTPPPPPPRPPFPPPPCCGGSQLSPIRVGAIDPNEIVGSPGVGSAHWLNDKQPLKYVEFFENNPAATAPAADVIVTDQLDLVNMDLNTFSLGPIGFGNRLVFPAAGLSQFSTDVDLRQANNLILRINAGLDKATGIVTWRFTSLDPATLLPTGDPLAGFLPPNTAPPAGDGSVLYTVMPKTGRSTGAQVSQKARIVFDANPPIDTGLWVNTFDNSPPQSHVLPLAATQTSQSFAVNWSGTDTGAGISDYTVFVSDNSLPFTTWMSSTPATSGTFVGQQGHQYGFYSIARDLVGNVEISKTTAETTTTVKAPTIQCTGCYFLINNLRATLAFNVGVVESGSTFTYNYRSSTQAVQFISSSTSQIAVNGNTATFSGQGNLNGQSGYSFVVTATDGGGVGSGLDTVAILITGPNNYSYLVNGTVVGGDIVVKQKEEDYSTFDTAMPSVPEPATFGLMLTVALLVSILARKSFLWRRSCDKNLKHVWTLTIRQPLRPVDLVWWTSATDAGASEVVPVVLSSIFGDIQAHGRSLRSRGPLTPYVSGSTVEGNSFFRKEPTVHHDAIFHVAAVQLLDLAFASGCSSATALISPNHCCPRQTEI